MYRTLRVIRHVQSTCTPRGEHQLSNRSDYLNFWNNITLDLWDGISITFSRHYKRWKLPATKSLTWVSKFANGPVCCRHHLSRPGQRHYGDVIMSAMVSQITSLTIIYSIGYSGADQIKFQSSASLAFVRGIHRWPVNSRHKMASNEENVSIWRYHHGAHALAPAVTGRQLNSVIENKTFASARIISLIIKYR